MFDFAAIVRQNDELMDNIEKRRRAASAEYFSQTALGTLNGCLMNQVVRLVYNQTGGFTKIANRKQTDWIATTAAADRPSIAIVVGYGYDDDGGFLEIAKLGVSRTLRTYLRGLADVKVIDVQNLADLTELEDLQPQPG